MYTPGDNEWTDCHRTNNGAYNPLERLAKVRSTFFPLAGTTLGQNPIDVRSQADEGYIENVSYSRADIAFAAIHIVGSNNSLALWTGHTNPTPEQTAEVLGRTAADIELIRDTVPCTSFNGDSHVFNEDHPLAAGSSWLSFYGVAQPVADLTRITVEGSTGVDEWLKVTVDKHDPAVLNITRVPFS